MTAFHANRIVHEFIQANPAAPEKVFPLLCPVREAEWLPGWQYRLIYSDSGVAELGCVFTTPKPPGSGGRSSVGEETTWIVTDYDPTAFRIAYVWPNPGRMVSELRIQLAPAEQGCTRTRIYYRYTALSPEGNQEIGHYTQQWFEANMKNWEATINHYLNTGTKMSA